MSTDKNKSQIVEVLREGVAVVQMVFFKELRTQLSKRFPDLEQKEQLMLTGAITNELFGTRNLEARFVEFRKNHQTMIEQELLGLATNMMPLRPYITDALRVQTLCDSHEGSKNTDVLVTADRIGILLKDRDIPLPSVFMTFVRGLGEQHQLIVPPVQITTDDDSTMVH
ncbi:MAG: hypothetical protein V2I35_13190 [Desulfocapsaceae bacterium]|jgi:hypothetical protein|nr:hypothetical protein [Desulfocapsaceae bacterium]